MPEVTAIINERQSIEYQKNQLEPRMTEAATNLRRAITREPQHFSQGDVDLCQHEYDSLRAKISKLDARDEALASQLPDEDSTKEAKKERDALVKKLSKEEAELKEAWQSLLSVAQALEETARAYHVLNHERRATVLRVEQLQRDFLLEPVPINDASPPVNETKLVYHQIQLVKGIANGYLDAAVEGELKSCRAKS